MKSNLNQQFLIVGGIGFLVLFFLEGFISELIFQKSIFSDLILRFYPTLPEKLNSLGEEDISFYINQLKLRWLAIVAFSYYLIRFTAIEPYNPVDNQSVLWKIRLFYIVQLVYLPDLLQELRFRGQWKALFEPLLLFSFFETSFPLEYFIQVIGILLFAASAILVLVKWEVNDFKPLILSIFIFLAWTYLLSLFFGFGKIDHTYSSLYMGLLGMVFCRYYVLNDSQNSSKAYLLFQAFIWSCYFFSGLEKVFLSGYQWFQSGHFQILCHLHPTGLCEVLEKQPIVGELLLILALSFQLLSCLQWRFPKWGYVNVFGGIAFHLGTWLVFDVGGWQSPWIVMLLFLWPMSNVKKPV